MPPAAEQSWWYQYYFATERGRAGYDANRNDFARLIWRTASPQWRFDDETFDTHAPLRSTIRITSRSSSTTIAGDWASRRVSRNTTRSKRSSQRSRRSRCRRSRSKATPTVRPTPSLTRYAARFTGKYEHRTIAGGIGHNLPQEAPVDFTDAIVAVDSFAR